MIGVYGDIDTKKHRLKVFEGFKDAEQFFLRSRILLLCRGKFAREISNRFSLLDNYRTELIIQSIYCSNQNAISHEQLEIMTKHGLESNQKPFKSGI